MKFARPTGTLSMWLVGGLTLALGVSVLIQTQRGKRSANGCPECTGIYESLLKAHLSDDHWLETHAVLNISDGSRFIVSDMERVLREMKWSERFWYRFEINDFLKQKDGAPLLYATKDSRLRLISPSDRKGTLRRGITLLTFTLPGISCDGRHAVVYAITETQGSPLVAPFFSGSLINLIKNGSSWTIDHSKGLPRIDVVS